jgi:hypothetical protein
MGRASLAQFRIYTSCDWKKICHPAALGRGGCETGSEVNCDHVLSMWKTLAAIDSRPPSLFQRGVPGRGGDRGCSPGWRANRWMARRQRSVDARRDVTIPGCGDWKKNPLDARSAGCASCCACRGGWRRADGRSRRGRCFGSRSPVAILLRRVMHADFHWGACRRNRWASDV